MTNAGPLLVAELTTDPRTSALVGDRVVPKRMEEQGEFPQIVYHRISGPHQYSQDGDTGLQSPRYQLDIWARDPDSADAVAEAVIDVLSGRSFGGVTFTIIVGDRDDYEPPTGFYRRIVDAMPHLQE